MAISSAKLFGIAKSSESMVSSSPSTPQTAATLTVSALRKVNYGRRVDYCCSCRFRGVFVNSTARNWTPTSAMVRDGGESVEDRPLVRDSTENSDNEQVADKPPKVQERDFSGTAYVPVYVMLPLGVINMDCELVDPDNLLNHLKILKSVNVDGVMVDCWWGIVERHSPQQYNWSGYKRLFQIVRDLELKLQVVTSFHKCGGNIGDDVHIPLPEWVTLIGQSNPDIFFTDREGRHNPECLSWGIDKERVLRGRTAVEVYFDYMRSFRVEFDEFFEDGVISEIEIGLGPCGELRYPSYPAKHGWKYPGIGEFQVLVDHGDRILSLANLAFEGTCIAAKLSGIHWWYKTASHAAELTAGFYNPCNRDGYAPIAKMLKKHEVALNFTCVEMRTLDQHEDFPEALADPEGLVWQYPHVSGSGSVPTLADTLFASNQALKYFPAIDRSTLQVLNAAWDVSIPVASENALPCYDREGYNKILENAKPLNDPDGRHLSAFTYLRLSPVLMENHNFMEFERFVKRMHGSSRLSFRLVHSHKDTLDSRKMVMLLNGGDITLCGI
ncbi:beta-amylase 2 [Actinidia rufa]|uniref:Beta-amylase n=1 Tax=Actinidia rufa TaxID=165716 RepID=A0A7J0G7U6_9ERIC|nr:beta-amylase 2 [Actinidia rufa]